MELGSKFSIGDTVNVVSRIKEVECECAGHCDNEKCSCGKTHDGWCVETSCKINCVMECVDDDGEISYKYKFYLDDKKYVAEEDCFLDFRDACVERQRRIDKELQE